MQLCANYQVDTRQLYGLQAGIVIREHPCPSISFLAGACLMPGHTHWDLKYFPGIREIFARAIDWIGTRHEF